MPPRDGSKVIAGGSAFQTYNDTYNDSGTEENNFYHAIINSSLQKLS